MHAEKCPVCNGHAKIRAPTGSPELADEIVPCHGCVRGWITVMDPLDHLLIKQAQAVLPTTVMTAEPAVRPPPRGETLKSSSEELVTVAPDGVLMPTHVYLSRGLAARLLEDGNHYKGHTTAQGYELTEIWIGHLCIMEPKHG